jgi:hypothetical protein
MVYSKICTTSVKAVGPKWYRLEVIDSAKELGYFEEPWRFSGAVKRQEVGTSLDFISLVAKYRNLSKCKLFAQGIEFSSEEPLALFDLPKRYNFVSALPEVCFRYSTLL